MARLKMSGPGVEEFVARALHSLNGGALLGSFTSQGVASVHWGLASEEPFIYSAACTIGQGAPQGQRHHRARRTTPSMPLRPGRAGKDFMAKLHDEAECDT